MVIVSKNSKIVVSIFLYVLTTISYAQSDTTWYSCPAKRISFQINPFASKMLNFKHYSNRLIEQKTALGFNFGFSYHKKLKNNYFFSIGLNQNFMVEKTDFKVNITGMGDIRKGGLPFPNDISMIFPYYQIPISISQLLPFPKRKHSYLNYSIGLGINYFVDYGYSSGGTVILEDDSEFSYFNMTIENGAPQLIPSLIGKIGLLKVTKRGGYSYGFNAVVNYTPFSSGTGKYEFKNIDVESFGDVSVNSSYIGVELVQGVTLKKDNKVGYFRNNKSFFLHKDTMDIKSQIKISAMPILLGGINVKPTSGAGAFAYKPTLDMSGGIYYYQYLKSNLGITVGFQLTSMSLKDGLKPGSAISKSVNSHFYTFPISLQKVLKEKTNINYTGAVGFTTMYVNPYKDSGGWYWENGTVPQNIVKSELHFNLKSNNKLGFGAFAKIGVSKKTFNSGSSINFNLVAHYSPTVIASGTYNYISEDLEKYPEGKGSGEITQQINYIGLELVYGLTLKKEAK